MKYKVIARTPGPLFLVNGLPFADDFVSNSNFVFAQRQPGDCEFTVRIRHANGFVANVNFN